MSKINSSALFPILPTHTPVASDLKRTIVHLADQDRQALRLIRKDLELNSSALAIRLAVRSLAAEIELKGLIQELVTDWETGEGKEWVEFAGGVE